jgi:hypothetical protein
MTKPTSTINLDDPNVFTCTITAGEARLVPFKMPNTLTTMFDVARAHVIEAKRPRKAVMVITVI